MKPWQALCAVGCVLGTLALFSGPSLAQEFARPRDLIDIPQDDPDFAPLVQAIDNVPDAAGAWLDLAVLLCQRGFGTGSQQALAHIEEAFDPPEGIREVAQVLRQSQCIGKRPDRELLITVQRGYDNNVNQGASNPLFELGGALPGVVLTLSPEFLPIGDQFTSFDAALATGQQSDTSWTFQLREKRHDRQQRFDTRILSIARDQRWNCEGWACRLGAAIGHVELGGRSYQHLGSLQASATRGGAGPSDMAMTLDASIGQVVFPTLSNFDAWVAQTRATWRWPLQRDDYLQWYVNAGIDRPRGARPGGQRQFWGVGASGRHGLTGLGAGAWLEWSLQNLSMRDSDFYAPGIIDVRRKPALNVALLALALPLPERQTVRLELRRTINRDSLSLFSYFGTTIFLSWQWQAHF